MKIRKYSYLFIGLIAILFFVLSFIFEYECPFYTHLGIKCPACGSRQMVVDLLHFNIIQAFLDNPLVFILGLLIFALIVFKIVFKKDVKIYPAYYFILIASIVVFTILRNIF